MANKTGLNTPDVKNEFNNAAKKNLGKQAEGTNKGIPASQVQINNLDKQRPKLEKTLKHTPTGSITKEVNAAENAKKNAEISKKQNEFRERMQAQKSKAREDFALAKQKDQTKTAFNRAAKESLMGEIFDFHKFLSYNRL